MEGSGSKKSRAPSQESQFIRKRHRAAVVCINCRKKKIKCDKKKPECDNCMKVNIKCQYQDLVWASSTLVDDEGKVSSFHDYSGQTTFALNDTVSNMKFSDETKQFKSKLLNQRLKEGKTSMSHNSSELPEGHPPVDVNEVMDFFEGTISTDEIVRSGPFSWLIFASKDRFIRFLWLKASQPKQRQHLYLNTTLEDDKLADEAHELYHKLSNLKAKVIVPSYQPMAMENVKKVILSNLPTKRALWILVPRFYEYIYPYLSYVSWDEFITSIKTALNTHENDFKDEKFTSITIYDKSVLCHFAILFVMLRFGYLSLCEEVLDESETRKYILLHPISVDSVSSGQILLNQFNIFDKPPIELLEGFIYMRWYHHYSPEQGDYTGIADSTVFNGIIVALAVSLGLNRDPGYIEQYKNDHQYCNLRRRLWHFVAMFDLYHTVSLGRPNAYNTGNCAVKFPEILEGDDLEQKILTTCFKDYCEGYHIVSETAAGLMDSHSANIYNLIKGIKKADTMRNLEFKTVSDILHQKTDLQDKPHVRLRRVIKLIRYVFINTFCFTTEYNIFLHFENSDRSDKTLARYYLRRLIARSNEAMEHLPILMTKASDFLGYGLDIIHFPATLLSLHKALQVQTSLSLRCQHLIRLIQLKKENSSEDDRNCQKYLRLISVSIAIKLEEYLKNLNNACQKYQYAWRLKRPHTLIWFITNQDCFKVIDGKVVVADSEIFDDPNPEVPQDNILVGMSYENLKALYPMSDEEILSLKHKKKHGSTSHKTDPAGIAASIKNERSPSISNLLNREGAEDTSSSSSSIVRSPSFEERTFAMDPNVDRSWIKLLYTDQNFNSITDPALILAQEDVNQSSNFHPPPPVQQSMPYAQNYPQQQQQQQQFQTSQLPNMFMAPDNSAHVISNQQQQPNPDAFLQHLAQPEPQLIQQGHLHQLQEHHIQHLPQPQHHSHHNSQHLHHQHHDQHLHQHQDHLNQYQQQQQELPSMQIPYQDHQQGGHYNYQAQSFPGQPNHHFDVQQNHQDHLSNGMHEFFSLIGAGGFNTVDEMFGSVEFFDKSL